MKDADKEKESDEQTGQSGKNVGNRVIVVAGREAWRQVVGVGWPTSDDSVRSMTDEEDVEDVGGESSGKQAGTVLAC